MTETELKHTHNICRIHGILSRVRDLPKNGANVHERDVLTGWSAVFGLDPITSASTREKRIEIIEEELILIRRELRTVLEAMTRTHLDRDEYEPGFEKAIRATSLNLLEGKWMVVMQLLDATTLALLKIACRTLPKDDIELSKEELDEITALINDLESRCASSTMAPDLKSYFYDQIGRLRRALFEYPVRGSAAFREGLYYTHGTWASEGRYLDTTDPEARASVGLLETITEKFQAAAFRTTKFLGAAKHMALLAKGAGDAADAIRDALPDNFGPFGS